MRCRMFAAIVAAAIAMGGVAAAQTSNLTFRVPLNLTQLPSDLTSVRIECVVQSAALANAGIASHQMPHGKTDISVSNGQVVTTTEVVVPVSSDTLIQANAVGTSASYECRLMGAFTSNSSYVYLDQAGSGVARLSPLPAKLTGTFTW